MVNGIMEKLMATYLIVVGVCITLLTAKATGLSIDAKLDLADFVSLFVAVIAASIAYITLKDTRDRRNEDKKVDFLCEAVATLRLRKDGFPKLQEVQDVKNQLVKLERSYLYLSNSNKGRAKKILDNARGVVLIIGKYYEAGLLPSSSLKDILAPNENVIKIGKHYEQAISEIQQLVADLGKLEPFQY
jgi:hypothetical protein